MRHWGTMFANTQLDPADANISRSFNGPNFKSPHPAPPAFQRKPKNSSLDLGRGSWAPQQRNLHSLLNVCAYAIDSKSGQLDRHHSLSLSLRQHELHEGRGPRDETRQDRLQAPTEDCSSLRRSENSRTATSPNFDRESEREAGKGLQLEGEPEFFFGLLEA